jgi:hypothetical protein
LPEKHNDPGGVSPFDFTVRKNIFLPGSITKGINNVMKEFGSIF